MRDVATVSIAVDVCGEFADDAVGDERLGERERFVRARQSGDVLAKPRGRAHADGRRPGDCPEFEHVRFEIVVERVVAGRPAGRLVATERLDRGDGVARRFCPGEQVEPASDEDIGDEDRHVGLCQVRLGVWTGDVLGVAGRVHGVARIGRAASAVGQRAGALPGRVLSERAGESQAGVDELDTGTSLGDGLQRELPGRALARLADGAGARHRQHARGQRPVVEVVPDALPEPTRFDVVDRVQRGTPDRRDFVHRPRLAEGGAKTFGNDPPTCPHALFPVQPRSSVVAVIETDTDSGGDGSGDVRVVTLDRPERRNALTPAALDALESAVTAADTPVVSLRGVGSAFCAGADLDAVAGLGDREAAERFAARGQRVARAIETCDAVVVAEIDGPARGGGVELALACDLRVATPDASFAESGVALGLFGAWGGTVRLPAVVGPSDAMDMALSGRVVDAREARRMGLVSRVVDEPRTVTRAVADNDAAALATLKRRLRDDADRATRECREREAFSDLWADFEY